MFVRVQIAGLKNEYDALNAVFAGADAIGLVIGVTPYMHPFLKNI